MKPNTLFDIDGETIDDANEELSEKQASELFAKHKTFKSMHGCFLEKGPHEGEVIEVAPTMKNITREGNLYFRMEGAKVIKDGKVYAMYLWDGWGKQMREEFKMKADAK